MSKVSVIVPVYNAQPYLKQCLDSICAQTLKEIEIICVNDGSADGSAEILREYAERDHRVHVIDQDNLGAGSARNAGLAAARGEYLSFLDADDFFEPEMLEKTYLAAKKAEADVCIFEADLYNQQTKEFSYCYWSFQRKYFEENKAFNPRSDSYRENIFRMFTGWAWDKLFRREFVERHHLQFQELRTTNDMYFVYSALSRAERILPYPGVFAHQRIQNKHSLSNTRERSYDCFYKALLKLKEGLVEANIFPIFERAYVNWTLNLSLWHLNTISDAAAVKIYRLLQEGGFDHLGVTEYDESFYFDSNEYKKMQEILSQPVEQMLLRRIDNLVQENIHLMDEKQTLLDEKRKLENSMTSLQKDMGRLSNRINELEDSTTYKLGAALLYIPKKIIRCLKKQKAVMQK